MRIFLAVVLITVLVKDFVSAEEIFKYDAKAKRDPFVPLVSEGGAYVSDAYGISSIRDIRLEGIVWDESRGSIAIINGEIVQEGQEIGVVKVLKIEKDAVTFDADGEVVRIELANE